MPSARETYPRHRYPIAIISHAVWLYHRFALSFRDIEELLAERGVDVTYESIRQRPFKSPGQAQRFLAVHSRVTNLFAVGRHHLKAMHLGQRVIPFWNKRRNQRLEIDWRFTRKKAKLWISSSVIGLAGPHRRRYSWRE